MLSSARRRRFSLALDAVADKHHMRRVIDESGEDYLRPKAFFRSIALRQAGRRALLAA
jgi:hypothetical protein